MVFHRWRVEPTKRTLVGTLALLLLASTTQAEPPKKRHPRQTAGEDVVSYFDYGDRWTDGKVYLLEHVKNFQPSERRIPESRYGGRADKRVDGTGFFCTVQADGRWWLVDPEGCLYFAVGVNQLRYDKKNYGPEEEWARGAIALLRDNGFNSFTEASRPSALEDPLPYASNLMLTFGYLIENHIGDKRVWDAPPLWEPELKQFVEKRCATICTPLKDDPYLIGWFTDNEMHWSADALDRSYDLYENDEPYEITAKTWQGEKKYTVRPNEMASYRVVADWVKEHGFRKGEQGFSWEARQQFQQFQATRYAKLVHDAIRKADPNHMILGARHVRQDVTCPEVFKGMGKYFDVISLNYYGAWPPDPVVLKHLSIWSGKPVMITEFFAQSLETKPRYTRDGWIVKNQADRGKYYQNTALACFQIPECVGLQWFRYADSTDANFGIVDIHTNPYDELLQRMKAVNEVKYQLIDHLSRQPLDLSEVYDPLRTTEREVFSEP
ncbi:MAG TPA: hypothetical protein VE890_06255 [Thermoguttaceae bacterium]|nr:hypothetical protein [Thermoguttaceae bacterium]